MDIVSMAKAGDSFAIEKLYTDNIGLIKKICWKFYNYYDDCIQEAYFALLKSIQSYNPAYDTKFTTYFGHCLYFHLIRYVKRNRFDYVSIYEPIGYDSTSTILDTIADNNARTERTEAHNIAYFVNKALMKIPRLKRAVVYEVDGMRLPLKAVAKRYNISAGAIHQHRLSGRIKLRRDADLMKLWKEYEEVGFIHQKTRLEAKGEFI